jgi:hypothetical protein
VSNVIRFPIERGRVDAYDAERYAELVAPGVVFVGDRGEDMCPSWGHIWAMGNDTCLCGQECHDSGGVAGV